MRLSNQQATILKTLITKHRPHAEVFLFGSRVDDEAYGGDIDILVLDDLKLDLKELVEIERSFCKKFGEQKIDIVCFDKKSKHPFKKLSLLKAISL
jgi:predicted nucleotidyltransferase